jgi:hypothetical protein
MPHVQPAATQADTEADALSALEASMRRALGAMGSGQRPLRDAPPQIRRDAGFPAKRPHRFVRDGGVPVEMVSRLHGRAPAHRAARPSQASGQELFR